MTFCPDSWLFYPIANLLVLVDTMGPGERIVAIWSSGAVDVGILLATNLTGLD